MATPSPRATKIRDLVKFLSSSLVAPMAAGAAPPTAIPVPMVARPVERAAPRYWRPCARPLAASAAVSASAASAPTKAGMMQIISTMQPIKEPALTKMDFLMFTFLPCFLRLRQITRGIIMRATATRGIKKRIAFSIFQFLRICCYIFNLLRCSLQLRG